MAAGLHELEFRLNSARESIASMKERGSYLLSWLQSQDAEAETEGSESDFPAEATSAIETSHAHLREFAKLRAQALDRAEAASGEVDSNGGLELRTAEIEQRLGELSAAMSALEVATDWIDSFQRVGASGTSFSIYTATTAGELTKLTDAVEQALLEIENCISEVALCRAQTKKRIPEAKSKEPDDQTPRTARQLRELLDGRWVVSAVDRWGQGGVQEIELTKHLLSHDKYVAHGPGWRAEGIWEVLNGTSVRVEGRTSMPPNSIVSAPFLDLLEFEVIDGSTLRSHSSMNVSMEWKRAESR